MSSRWTITVDLGDKPYELSVDSVELVQVRVDAEKNGAVYNPTADTVQLAFVTVGADPAAGDWKTGSWETRTETEVTGTSTTYWAGCLVGSAVVLAKGLYDAYVKVTDNPETVVKPIGQLEVV